MRFSKKITIDVLRWCVAVVAANVFGWGGGVLAADSGNWATGPALRQKLAEPANLSWNVTPLRHAINSLSQTRHVAILVDRRVDPGQELSMSPKGDSLGVVLQAIAADRRLGVVLFGNIVYLGPEAATERLHAIAALLEKDVQRLPLDGKLKYRRTRKLAWEDLAAPRDLLTALTEENGLKIAGLERVPHDLWAAADLPAISLADRLTLIAVQLDLAVRLTDEGMRIQLEPLPADLPQTPGGKRGLLDASSSKRPAAKRSTNLDKTGIDKFAVERKPLDAILRTLADRFDLELKIDRESIQAAGISLDQRISLHDENTTLDKLLRKLLEPTELTFERRGRVLKIFPIPKSLNP